MKKKLAGAAAAAVVAITAVGTLTKATPCLPVEARCGGGNIVTLSQCEDGLHASEHLKSIRAIQRLDCQLADGGTFHLAELASP